MKKITILFIMASLIFAIGCQNEQPQQDKRIPVVDEDIGGTWVSDNTPDISFTLDRYAVSETESANLQLHIGETTFEGFYSIKHPYYKDYISLDDLSSDQSKLLFNMVKDTSGYFFYLVCNAQYSDNKIYISKTVSVPESSNKTEKTVEFQRLISGLTGAFSKQQM